VSPRESGEWREAGRWLSGRCRSGTRPGWRPRPAPAVVGPRRATTVILAAITSWAGVDGAWVPGRLVDDRHPARGRPDRV